MNYPSRPVVFNHFAIEGRSSGHEIETHYYAAIETEHGSGEHWILMTVLGKYGFRTHSPTKAMEVANQVIVSWYTLNSQKGTY